MLCNLFLLNGTSFHVNVTAIKLLNITFKSQQHRSSNCAQSSNMKEKRRGEDEKLLVKSKQPNLADYKQLGTETHTAVFNISYHQAIYLQRTSMGRTTEKGRKVGKSGCESKKSAEKV